MNWLTRTTSCC